MKSRTYSFKFSATNITDADKEVYVIAVMCWVSNISKSRVSMTIVVHYRQIKLMIKP